MKLRPQYLANRCLSLFRTYYLHNDYSRARGYFRQAFRAYPFAVLQWSYLRKFLRCLWR
ncbi:MAG: hypothetical protein R2864_12040 [Syntrophotaleaceae bacterium]